MLIAEFLGGGAYEPDNIFGSTKTKCDPSSEFSAEGCSFFELAGLQTPSSTKLTKIGTFKPDEGELEASLDVQYAWSTARGASIVYWTEARWMYSFTTELFNGKNKVQ
jgi:hypothetical protein